MVPPLCRVLVAVSQAFVYASLAVAPLMVETPTAIPIGAFTAMLVSILVALDTDQLTMLLRLPPPLAELLRDRIVGH